MQSNKITILLVEDNPADVILIRKALLEQADLDHELHVVSDGEAAMRVVDAAVAFPSIVVLDLNLPKRDGHEVLSHLRRNPRWAEIPVMVVTSSNRQEDRRRAFELGATGYCTKPASFDEFLRIGDSIRAMWIGAGRNAVGK